MLVAAYAVRSEWLRGGYAVATRWLRGGYAVATRWLRGGYAVATRSHGTLCDIYKRGSSVSSWLRGTRYAV